MLARRNDYGFRAPALEATRAATPPDAAVAAVRLLLAPVVVVVVVVVAEGGGGAFVRMKRDIAADGPATALPRV